MKLVKLVVICKVKDLLIELKKAVSLSQPL
jgi:hypothetical protein